jgi:hypothetical protein
MLTVSKNRRSEMTIRKREKKKRDDEERYEVRNIEGYIRFCTMVIL